MKQKGVIKYLKNELNIESYILSGDAKESVNQMGKEIEILQKNCYGALEPSTKKNILKQLKENDDSVIMIGDGVNDVLSLSEASFGVSFNANSQLNLISSDIVIVKEDLSLIIALINISKYSYYFIWLNIFWAFFYNILMIPMSSGFLMNYIMFDISPQLSSMFMLLSSLLVILNSNFLRFIKFNSYKIEGKYIDELKTRNEMNYLPNDKSFKQIELITNTTVINMDSQSHIKIGETVEKCIESEKDDLNESVMSTDKILVKSCCSGNK